MNAFKPIKGFREYRKYYGILNSRLLYWLEKGIDVFYPFGGQFPKAMLPENGCSTRTSTESDVDIENDKRENTFFKRERMQEKEEIKKNQVKENYLEITMGSIQDFQFRMNF